MARFDGPTLGDRIVQLRRALGSVTKALSREDLADLLAKQGAPYAPSSIARAEKNEVPIPLPVAMAMAELAGLTLDEFAKGAQREVLPLATRMRLAGAAPDEPEKAAAQKADEHENAAQSEDQAAGGKWPRKS